MIKERLSALRKVMKEKNIDIYLVPTSDFHNSEYVGKYFKCREYITGFTGSAGTAVITSEEAGLWTDGRYFLQAADELRDTTVTLYKMGEEGVPTILEYLSNKLKAGMTLGFDGRVFPVAAGKKYQELASKSSASIVSDIDLVGDIWNNRPALSANPVFLLDKKYNGKSTSEKLADIRLEMQKKNADSHVVTSLDDIAWILNLRGSDVNCNPVFLSYLLITESSGVLFANTCAFSTEIKDYLDSVNIKLLPYNDIYSFDFNSMGCKNILIDEGKLNWALYSVLNNGYTGIAAQNPSTFMKAVKNETEIASLKNCNITDGVAMVRFLKYLDENIGRNKLTEMSVSDKLEEIRSKGEDFVGISFETIAGYNAHGAIIHYEPTPQTDIEINPEGLLLVDSGAQYLGGTTDITRTIAMGPLTDEMKHHYTMVLRSHLNILSAVFMEGASGANLDMLAREPFWSEFENYNHGTGHGVGFFLNVHEGPFSLSWQPNRPMTQVPFKEGMLVTNEPGIYIEGKYGVRIENDVLCKKLIKNEYGQFMGFEALTLCPIDLRPVIKEELSPKQISVLNAYHKKVRETLSPFLDADEKLWLENATVEI